MQEETLIVEDVLLLMLDDEHGVPAGAATLQQTLAGAVLVELALLGRIRPEEDRPWYKGTKILATGDGPLPDPVLQAAYDAIAARPRHAQTLLVTIGADLWKTLTERLVQRGLLRRERKRVLGLFTTTRLPAADTGHEAELRDRMREVLEHGEDADPRLAAIIALISASGTLPSLDPAPKWSGAVATRAKEFEQGDWGAAAVNDAVVGVAASFTAASTAVVITTVTT
ncbi:GPP34 family phosphoprotein [Saccharopolyspora sp. NFXS83]|uniref:GOLPH3/VPS74 family protein n=1 Tax=Saccharopolyspora sp. NFXS83 TaxID=2993560 RepID=UPI00224A4D20|nr:GPP34 family phosphoprotein [Saccharopolyspora sp. NFXS83]MCX2729333.1 GPP34 family phosphoprotein [Saccharopolyspora sp. NFXS83]